MLLFHSKLYYQLGWKLKQIIQVVTRNVCLYWSGLITGLLSSFCCELLYKEPGKKLHKASSLILKIIHILFFVQVQTFTSDSSIIRVITVTGDSQNWCTCAVQELTLPTRALHIIQHYLSCPLTKLCINQCDTSWRERITLKVNIACAISFQDSTLFYVLPEAEA